MDILGGILALIGVIVFLSLGLFGMYCLIVGGFKNDRKQVVFGLKCLLGGIVTIIVLFFIVMRYFHPGVC